tara:strand:- start:764 stop:1519 length:756 start_codon:yes stop_codon:yes gene_type:complete
LNTILSTLFLSLLLSSNLIAQSEFITEETTVASFKMGSMQSSVYNYFSENSYHSRMDFSFKGKGIARLMSRDVDNGTAISFEDSTIVKINYNKNRFTKQSFSEFLAEKNSSENSENESENSNEQSDSDEDDSDPIVSDTAEMINGFESYKIILNDDIENKQFIWVTAKEEQSVLVKTMKEKIAQFENSWGSFDINFSELGMNENAILVKAIFTDQDGSFEYNLKKYSSTNGMPEMFNMPKEYKKVKKLKMF